MVVASNAQAPRRAGRAGWTGWTGWACGVVGAAGLGTLAVTIALRVGFAWPLEWMEGASLQHALRLLCGAPLYAPPSAEFIAYLYPPLAYLPMALSAAVLGPSLFAARLPSVCATALTLCLVGRVCARRAGSTAAGLAGAGVFAAGYGYTGAFLDLARVDALFVLLCAAGAERLDAGRARAALACLLAAAFAKQHGVLFLFAASAWLLAADWRRHRTAVGSTWLLGAAVFAALELGSDGWFSRYVLALPASHRMRWELLGSFVLVDVCVYLPALALAAGVALWRRVNLGPLAPLLAAGVVAGALGRAHPGGEDNVRLPAFLLLVLVGVPLLARALVAARTRTRVIAALGLAAQLAILWQPPSAHRPLQASAAGFERLAGALRRCAAGGRAVAADYALLAGTPFVHTMALWDIEQGGDHALAARARAALAATLSGNDAPAALALGRHPHALVPVIRRYYADCARVAAPALATGHQPGLAMDGRLVQVVYARELRR